MGVWPGQQAAREQTHCHTYHAPSTQELLQIRTLLPLYPGFKVLESISKPHWGHHAPQCLIKQHGHVSRCGKVFGTWERLGQKSFRSCTEVLMSWDYVFSLKGENSAAFLLETALRGQGTRTTSKQVRIPLHASLLRRLERSKTILTAFKRRIPMYSLICQIFNWSTKYESKFWNHYVKSVGWRHRLIDIT